MNCYRNVFSHATLQAAPPVMVDVGASGAMHPPWRKLARFAVGVGFEPDRRETAAASRAGVRYRRWINCAKLVTDDEQSPSVELHLTQFPFCSSTLRPDAAALSEWAFSRLFEVAGQQKMAATTLAVALREHGLATIDWLKCDTQGTDLRIWQSLPESTRRNTLVVEFEPGVIDAYQGEDKLHHVLAAMEAEPFWLAGLEVQGTPRGNIATIERHLGTRGADYFRKYGPAAPGWANALYLRKPDDSLDLRQHLLLWVFATELGQPSFACTVAEEGSRRFGDPLFAQLTRISARQMRGALLATWPRWPALLWHKLAARFP